MKHFSIFLAACVLLLLSSLQFTTAQSYYRSDITVGPGLFGGPWAVEAARDSGYAVYSYGGYNGDSYQFLTRMDKSGNALWSRGFRSATETNVIGMQMVEAMDGGWVCFMDAYNIFSVTAVKYDAAGNVEWSKAYTPNHSFQTYDILATPDSSYYLIGGGCATGAGFAMRLESNGDIAWYKSYFSTGGGAYKGLVNSQGNLVLCGSALSTTQSGMDLTIQEIAPNGRVIWAKRYPTGRTGATTKICEYNLDGNPGYAMTTQFQHMDSGAWVATPIVLTVDATGNFWWADSLSGLNLDPRSIIQGPDGKLIVFGRTPEGRTDMRLNSFMGVWQANGQYEKTYLYGNGAQYGSSAREVSKAANGDLLFCMYGGGGTGGIEVIRGKGTLDSICEIEQLYPQQDSFQFTPITDTTVFNNSISQPAHTFVFEQFQPSSITTCQTFTSWEPILEETLKVYPNPARDHFVLESSEAFPTGTQFELSDAMGQSLKSVRLRASSYRVQFSLEALPVGLFFYQITSPDGVTQSGRVLHQ